MTERDFDSTTKWMILIKERWSTYDTRVQLEPKQDDKSSRETLNLENDMKDRKVKT